MKKILGLSFLTMLYFSVCAQEVDSVKVYLSQGVALHEKGDYDGAISSYDKALKIDQNNLIALAEKALTLLSLKDYNSVMELCKLAINEHPQSEGLKYVYATYANAFDESGKPDEAIKIYDQGIEQFPDYY